MVESEAAATMGGSGSGEWSDGGGGGGGGGDGDGGGGGDDGSGDVRWFEAAARSTAAATSSARAAQLGIGSAGGAARPAAQAMAGGAHEDACFEEAVGRFVEAAEHDAEAVEKLEAAIAKRQSDTYGALDQRREARRRLVHATQASVRAQMSEKQAAKAVEETARRSGAAAAQVPILARDSGVAAVLGASPHPEVDEAGLSPRALLVHRMRSKVTDGGVKGKGAKVSQWELLASLEAQMEAKTALDRERHLEELDEERRFLEHVKAEMHLHSTSVLLRPTRLALSLSFIFSLVLSPLTPMHIYIHIL
jgi:hypothetical protein